MFKKHLKYLWYLIKHKYYVGKECFRMKLYWRGIVHDWTKFDPREWRPYANYFYGDHVGEEKEFWSEQFDLAWLKHIKSNPHHWQYWLLIKDDGSKLAIEMPRRFYKEMVADWIGAGIAINGRREVKSWYNENKNIIVLNENTRKKVEALIYSDENSGSV